MVQVKLEDDWRVIQVRRKSCYYRPHPSFHEQSGGGVRKCAFQNHLNCTGIEGSGLSLFFCDSELIFFAPPTLRPLSLSLSLSLALCVGGHRHAFVALGGVLRAEEAVEERIERVPHRCEYPSLNSDALGTNLTKNAQHFF